MIKPAYSVSFLLSITIFVWQNVLYFLDAPRTSSPLYENLVLAALKHSLRTKKLFLNVLNLFFHFISPFTLFMLIKRIFNVERGDLQYNGVQSLYTYLYSSIMT